MFVENAGKMNIDISEIDTVIISHGHKDHGGALKHFLGLNSQQRSFLERSTYDLLITF